MSQKCRMHFHSTRVLSVLRFLYPIKRSLKSEKTPLLPMISPRSLKRLDLAQRRNSIHKEADRWLPRLPIYSGFATDQQRYDTIGALGNLYVSTPNIDSLVADGVAFTHAYCQSPICTPSRASFLTGMYPNATHANRNGNDFFPRRVSTCDTHPR